MRIGLEKNLREIGEELNFSGEYVRQIEKKAIEKLREFNDIHQCVGSRKIRSARRLKTLYKWRVAIRKATQKALAKDLGRPLVLQDILVEVNANGKKGLCRGTFFSIQSNDSGIRQLITETLEESLKKRLAKAIATIRQDLEENQPTPVAKTARLAGINKTTLNKIIRKKPHFLPIDVEFRTTLRDESLKCYAVDNLQKLLTSINNGEIAAPQTLKEIASLLGLWLTTLNDWRKTFPKELGPLVSELLSEAETTVNGNRKSPRVIARQAERLQKLEEAAKEYQQTNPGKLIPIKIMIERTGIPENTLSRLIQKNKEYLRSQGIEFRSSRRGDKKEEYTLARIEEIRREVEESVTFAPKDKTELCKRLGVSRNTIINWEKSSDEIRKSIADLFAVNSDTEGRLHRRDQIPEEERPATFAQAYEITSNARDLGREPVKVVELAKAIGYSKSNIQNWINNIPEIIRSDMVLELRGSWKTIGRHRRLKWALDFAKRNDFSYLTLNEFLVQRLNITRGAFNLWKKEDPSLLEVFEKEKYTGIVQGRI